MKCTCHLHLIPLFSVQAFFFFVKPSGFFYINGTDQLNTALFPLSVYTFTRVLSLCKRRSARSSNPLSISVFVRIIQLKVLFPKHEGLGR